MSTATFQATPRASNRRTRSPSLPKRRATTAFQRRCWDGIVCSHLTCVAFQRKDAVDWSLAAWSPGDSRRWDQVGRVCLLVWRLLRFVYGCTYHHTRFLYLLCV